MSTDTAAPTPPAPGGGGHNVDVDAVAAAASALQAAASNEENRFSALNGRAAALVSASSLITALLAVFLGEAVSERLAGIRVPIAILLGLTLIALVASVLVAIVKVLLPSKREVFGDNAITAEAPDFSSAAAVHAEVWSEYRVVLAVLQDRNQEKAKGLNRSYKLFAVAAVLGFGAVIVMVGFSLRL